MIKQWLINLAVNTVVLMVIAGYFDAFYLSGVGSAILASLILSFLNAFMRPILVLLTLPVTILSLGLFLLVINAATLSLTAYIMGDAFNIGGFGFAIFAAIVISVFSLLIQQFIIRPLTNNHQD